MRKSLALLLVIPLLGSVTATTVFRVTWNGTAWRPIAPAQISWEDWTGLAGWTNNSTFTGGEDLVINGTGWMWSNNTWPAYRDLGLDINLASGGNTGMFSAYYNGTSAINVILDYPQGIGLWRCGNFTTTETSFFCGSPTLSPWIVVPWNSWIHLDVWINASGAGLRYGSNLIGWNESVADEAGTMGFTGRGAIDLVDNLTTNWTEPFQDGWLEDDWILPQDWAWGVVTWNGTTTATANNVTIQNGANLSAVGNVTLHFDFNNTSAFLENWSITSWNNTTVVDPPDLDFDDDGIEDANDSCPMIWGNATDLPGCPDPDGDGYNQDAFPGDPLEWNDRDSDTVGDNSDQCPDIWGNQTDGCPWVPPVPDTDGDGLNDSVDLCPNEAGPISNNGCPEDTGGNETNNTNNTNNGTGGNDTTNETGNGTGNGTDPANGTNGTGNNGSDGGGDAHPNGSDGDDKGSKGSDNPFRSSAIPLAVLAFTIVSLGVGGLLVMREQSREEKTKWVEANKTTWPQKWRAVELPEHPTLTDEVKNGILDPGEPLDELDWGDTPADTYGHPAAIMAAPVSNYVAPGEVNYEAILAEIESRMVPRHDEANHKLIKEVTTVISKIGAAKDGGDLAPRRYERLMREAKDLKAAIEALSPIFRMNS